MRQTSIHYEHAHLSASEARELVLALDPARLDIPQSLRRAAGLWARHWMEAEPDAMILMACNARARNRDTASRSLRLRRLASALVRHGVPRERIRFTTHGTTTPACVQAGERGVAWIKVLQPLQLEADVRPIESLFADRTAPLAA